MFVFLVLWIATLPKRHTNKIRKATKTCSATKRYWRPLKPVKMDFRKFLSFKFFFAEYNSKRNHLSRPLAACACVAWGKYS